MPTITKSIGTASRDYTTIVAWEADLDNGAIYSSGDDAVGEIYDDSVYTNAIVINGGGTVGLNSRKLTVPSSERHDGTLGNGARIVHTSSGVVLSLSLTTTVEWLSISKDNSSFSGEQGCININAANSYIRNCIVANVIGTNTTTYGIRRVHNTMSTDVVINCIIFNIHNTTRGSVVNGFATTTDRGLNLYNCTIHKITGVHASETLNGISLNNSSLIICKNVICTDSDNTGAGADNDFNFGASVVRSNNASSDTTGNVQNLVSSDEYVSTVGGSEDLHLKTGSVCIDAGTDLGTSPTNVNIDINGRDRDAQGDVWDIGAHETIPIIAVLFNYILNFEYEDGIEFIWKLDTIQNRWVIRER